MTVRHCVLARNLTFRGTVHQEAILATFNKRQVPLPSSVPVGLTREFAENAMKRVQWNAFIRRLIGIVEPLSLKETIETIREFIMPPLVAHHDGKIFDSIWPAGGPWTKKGEGDGSL